MKTPHGAPPDTLAAILGEFKANAGKMPQVNPPEAIKALEAQTAAEVAGHPEPEPVVEAAPAPVEKPAEVLAAEQAKSKSRRTAAVVQAELDEALKRIGELESALLTNVAPVATDSGAANDSEALAEAVELIQQLQGEAKLAAEDNAKAWARVAVVEVERDAAIEAGQKAFDAGVASARAAIAACDRVAGIEEPEQRHFLELADALQDQLRVGQQIILTGQR